VENLNEGDRFEVLRFATEVEGLFNTMTDATSANRKRAQDFIKDLKPIGGTAIDDALRKAMALRPGTGDRPFVIVFLTDGRPTVGTTDEQQIVGNVTKSNQSNTRVFCFGIGTDVNTHLLDKITEETKAFSQYVLPEEDLEVKVSSFFTKIKEPVLASPKLTFPADVRVTKLYPSPVPDLFKGEQIVLAGRYAGKGDGAVTLEGSVGGETRKFAFDVKFSEEARDHEFIPRLWATRRVGYLLDEIRLRGDSKELKDEVTELARKYGIVTPYTAYLIVEDEKQRGLAQTEQTLRFYGRDGLARRSLGASYEGATRERGGIAGVSGASSFQHLKMAESANDAIVAGNADAYRSAPAVLAPSTATLSSRTQLAREVTPRQTAKAFADQGRYVGGRTFFLNNEQWIDSDVQKKPNASRVRIQFSSEEYFALLSQQPQTSGWLALGRNVQFVLGDKVYEIYE
jgi:Ca-activated chloride channel family protein